MQLLVDGAVIDTSGWPAGSLEEFAGRAVRHVSAADEPRMVVGLSCDGRVVPEDRLEDFLSQPASCFELVELQTGTVRSLTRGLMEQLAEACLDIRELAGGTADRLARGETGGGLRDLQELLERWTQIHQAVQMVFELHRRHGIFGEDMAARIPDECDRWKTLLEQMREAVLARDHVLVQDLLRYEVPAMMDRWRALWSETPAP